MQQEEPQAQQYGRKCSIIFNLIKMNSWSITTKEVIEATNAAIKRKFGETLKSKNPVAQENELLAKIITYNLTVVIHEIYENGIDPVFLKSKACNVFENKEQAIIL